MRNDLSMNRIDNSGKGIAGLGRGEDSMLAHVAPGEMVVPPVISPKTQEIIKREMMAVGLDPNEYTVGGGMSINPITGMAEFGFLKKLGKSLKKVVKKVAPIAVNFIPGVGPLAKAALTAGVGKASGMSTKEALLGGALSFAGGKLFGGAGGAGSAAADAATKPGFFGRIGQYFNPAEGTKGIFGGKLGPGIRRGIGGLFTGGGMGGQQGGLTQEQFDALSPTEQQLYLLQQQQAQTGGGFLGGKSPMQFLSSKLLPQGVEDMLGTGPQGGGIFGGQQSQGGIGGMAGGFGGISPGVAALAALYGKAVKESYKDREGGMKDIRQSIRPDLMPAPTFTGFDLGIRKQAAMGGLQERPGFAIGRSAMANELDMRNGGSSIGPGTGTSDDIPAMLSDGEFVMTSAANNGLGGFKVTKTETGIELIPNGKPDRQKGAKNMDKLMKTFEQFNKIGQV